MELMQYQASDTDGDIEFSFVTIHCFKTILLSIRNKNLQDDGKATKVCEMQHSWFYYSPQRFVCYSQGPLCKN